MLEHMLEHVEGYEEVARAGACLDSAGFQISGCAFKHGGALCMSVACVAAERADGEYVKFLPVATAKPSAGPRGAPVICEPVAIYADLRGIPCSGMGGYVAKPKAPA